MIGFTCPLDPGVLNNMLAKEQQGKFGRYWYAVLASV